MIEVVPEKEIQSKTKSRQPMSQTFRVNEDLCWLVAKTRCERVKKSLPFS